MSKTIKFLLCVKNQTTENGRSFRKFFTFTKILVEGEEDKGLQEKTLTVRFNSELDTKKLRRGILTCDANAVDMPYMWRITKDKKTGKDRYPYIYVNSYIDFEPRCGRSSIEFDLKDESEEEESTALETPKEEAPKKKESQGLDVTDEDLSF